MELVRGRQTNSRQAQAGRRTDGWPGGQTDRQSRSEMRNPYGLPHTASACSLRLCGFGLLSNELQLGSGLAQSVVWSSYVHRLAKTRPDYCFTRNHTLALPSHF